MAKKVLTELGIKHLPEGMHWDARMPGFGVRVLKRRRTYVALVGGTSRVKVGLFGTLGLAEARMAASKLLVHGVQETCVTGFADAVERYLKHMEGELRPRTHYEYGLILRKLPFATTAVSGADVGKYLESIEKLSARVHAYSVMRIFSNWCVQHSLMESSPMLRVRKPKAPSARDRVLTDTELVKIWNACHDLGKFGAVVRLLMLTGQRKGQFALLKEEWVDEKNKVFVFPATVMKSNREHRVPYVYPVDFLLMRNGVYKGYYFSPAVSIGQPFSAWSKNKDVLDRMIDIDPWTLHDLRRTWSTNAARLDIPPHITERVLSHVAPEGKVAAIYNRYRYEDEMRAAMKKMADWLMLQIQEEGTPDPLNQVL